MKQVRNLVNEFLASENGSAVPLNWCSTRVVQHPLDNNVVHFSGAPGPEENAKQIELGEEVVR